MRLNQRIYAPPRAVETHAETHVVFCAGAVGYSLVERSGPPPQPGAEVVLDDGRYVAVRLGPSPFPADTRRCVFVQAG